MARIHDGKSPEEEAQDAEEEARQAIIAAAPRETCPFLGVVHAVAGRETSRAEQMQGAPPVAPALQAQFMPCLRHKCAFWNQEAAEPCVVKAGLRGMAEMNAARRSTSAGFTVKP